MWVRSLCCCFASCFITFWSLFFLVSNLLQFILVFHGAIWTPPFHSQTFHTTERIIGKFSNGTANQYPFTSILSRTFRKSKILHQFHDARWTEHLLRFHIAFLHNKREKIPKHIITPSTPQHYHTMIVPYQDKTRTLQIRQLVTTIGFPNAPTTNHNGEFTTSQETQHSHSTLVQ